ncbi:MAG TPA: metalloregulator ArsR/SmtB family transcription factor [Syntrophorhabdaceae bacterium]|nr:metalloregulator ArsR/SmtB family transcription factor [Syntrophorhabdaceae bacterium]
MEDIAQIYKALSERMRLRILMLLTHGELCVCDIMAVLEEPQSKVSRHVAYLKNSGLIKGKRVGTWMHYFLKEPLEGLAAAHVEFIRRELSGLDWAKADAEKMRNVQAKKLCEASAGGAAASGKSKTVKKRQAAMNKRTKANS